MEVSLQAITTHYNPLTTHCHRTVSRKLPGCDTGLWYWVVIPGCDTGLLSCEPLNGSPQKFYRSCLTSQLTAGENLSHYSRGYDNLRRRRWSCAELSTSTMCSVVHKVTTRYHNPVYQPSITTRSHNPVSQPGIFYEAVLNGLAAIRYHSWWCDASLTMLM